MPTIQSKKYPNNEQFITVEAWKIFQDTGRSRHFKVVDDGDMQDTVIAVPGSFTDFSKPPVVMEEEEDEPDFSDKETEEMNREDLKKWLTEHEIEFSPRISTPKLYQLYLDNQ